MAKKRRARLILELVAKGMSRREICRTRHMSMHTVKAVCDAAEERGVGWEEVRVLSDADADRLLFPEEAEARDAVARPDYALAHSELKRVGVTLKLLWQEYCDQAVADGSTPVSYTTYTRGYSGWVAAKNVTNHLDHKPGQVMEVDWSGATMWLADPVTGEASKAYLFVAVLPYSQYTYVEATADMRERAWLMCHVHAYEFFGGVAARLVCDNLKTGVRSHPRNGEPVLNEAYESLGRHYGAAIAPTGVRKPKQKASVEGAVGKVATAVVARLRDERFADLASLNAAIRERLDEFNAAPFQKREGSRADVFEQVEREALLPLPAVPYEPCEWVYGRAVNLDFHVVYETNRYSVPYQLVGRKVDLRVTDAAVEAYSGGERVATHPRFPPYVRYRPHTLPEHMPPEFARMEWDDARMRRWARSIGPSCAGVVERIFGDYEIKEQAYAPAMAVLNLSRTYGDVRLEAACGYALGKTAHPRSRFIRSVLASGADGRGAPEAPASESGGYVRVVGYYAEGGDGR